MLIFSGLQPLKLIPFILLLLAAWLYNGISRADTAMQQQDNTIIVDADWLQQHLDDSDILIIDAREPDKYQAGHIQGAVSLPVEKTFTQANISSKVAGLQTIQRLFRQAGIRRDHTVVVYDDDEHIAAGRLLWVLEVFGHPDVKLLNGGFKNWHALGLPVTTSVPDIKPSDYVATVNPRYLATRLDIQLALDDNSKQLIDARKQEEYLGKASRASRFGHIPGAINIPVDRALQAGKHSQLIRPLSELRQVYQGVDQSRLTYLYCNRGKQAALSYTILRQLGYNVAHYDGSWVEWGNNPALPIVKGRQLGKQ